MVAAGGEFVILICGGNADDSLVACRKTGGVDTLITGSCNQNDIPRPGIIDRILQTLTESFVAESHQDYGGAVVCGPENSLNDVDVLTEASRIQNFDR